MIDNNQTIIGRYISPPLYLPNSFTPLSFQYLYPFNRTS